MQDDRPDQYRKFAEACLRLARSASETRTRKLLITMAQGWNEMASRKSKARVDNVIDLFNRRQLLDGSDRRSADSETDLDETG